MLHTFTGTRDEAWFLLISLGIEARSGPILQGLFSCLRGMQENNSDLLLAAFEQLKSEMQTIKLVLERMPDKARD
jgi:indoleamine 2,3-dioxygenase